MPRCCDRLALALTALSSVLLAAVFTYVMAFVPGRAPGAYLTVFLAAYALHVVAFYRTSRTDPGDRPVAPT